MKKKHNFSFTTMFTVLFVSLLISVPAFAKSTPKEGDTETFQLLLTSDIHGSFINYNYATGKDTKGSIAQIATVIKQERNAFDGKTIVIDNGDTIQGNGTTLFINDPQYTTFPVIKAFEEIGYNVINLGNHEFNFGVEAMYKAYTGFTGDKLSGNVFKENGDHLDGFNAYQIFETDKGLRIAVIGVVSPNIERWDSSNVSKDKIYAESATKIVRQTIDELEEKDLADVFVVAGHMGEEQQYNREGSGAIDVVKGNPDIAVFLGAHFHTITGTKDEQVIIEDKVKFVENKNGGESVAKVLVTATYENGDWVVKNKIGTYEESDVKTDVIPVTADTPIDNTVADVLKDDHKAAEDYITKTVIGKLEGGPLAPKTEIDGTYGLYLEDNALIDLITSVMIDLTDADIAGTAPMDRKANSLPGEITIGGVVQIYKYDNNTLYKLGMTGEQVVKWMEWAYSYFNSNIDSKVMDITKPAVNLETDLTIPTGALRDYNQDQFAGINYEVDLTKPVGQRINVISMADGTPFEMDKEYVVAANNHRSDSQLLQNNEGGVFEPGESVARLIEDDVQAADGTTGMMDLIIAYIKKQPNQTIKNTVDNNWKFVNLDWDKELRSDAVLAINQGLIETDFRTPVTKEMVIKVQEQIKKTDEPAPEEVEVPEEKPIEKPEEVIEAPEEPKEPATEGKIHIVVEGDNLSKLANKYYNDQTKWQVIYDANKDKIKNPNMIYLKQELLIP